MEKDTPKYDICDRSFDFAVRTVKLCQAMSTSAGGSRTLSNQLLRSATSIGANIEEAQGGQSKPDFISKMSIALKETRETQYWLRLLVSANIVPTPRVTTLQQEATGLVAILTTIMKNARNKPA